MKRPATQRLKVFQTQLGFWDTVVAVSSQAAALKAWGVRQNLFASGDAKLATEHAAVAAALKHPEMPLRRAVGSSNPFELEPTHLPQVPHAPKRPTVKSQGHAKSVVKQRPKPDRSAFDAAEEALRSIEEARKSEEADFRARVDKLEADRLAAQHNYVDARKKAASTLAVARDAYRKAGGED